MPPLGVSTDVPGDEGTVAVLGTAVAVGGVVAVWASGAASPPHEETDAATTTTNMMAANV
jgi:hypothetical protein